MLFAPVPSEAGPLRGSRTSLGCGPDPNSSWRRLLPLLPLPLRGTQDQPEGQPPATSGTTGYIFICCILAHKTRDFRVSQVGRLIPEVAPRSHLLPTAWGCSRKDPGSRPSTRRHRKHACMPMPFSRDDKPQRGGASTRHPSNPSHGGAFHVIRHRPRLGTALTLDNTNGRETEAWVRLPCDDAHHTAV